MRIIAATNQPLEALVKEAKFREDLYYRLNVISVFIPPLRERKEDILPLARHFLKESGIKIHRPAAGFHPDAEALLMAHDWPGNIRELENAVEHAVVLSTTPEIRPSDLPFNVQKYQAVVEKKSDIPDALEDAQRLFRQDHIRGVLDRCDGNRTRASEVLGIQRAYLSRLIKELELDDV